MGEVARFGNVILPDEPVAALVETLEHLLAEARKGDIRAFAFATVRRDSKGTGWDGAEGTSDAVGAAVAMLFHRYTSAILDGEP